MITKGTVISAIKAEIPFTDILRPFHFPDSEADFQQAVLIAHEVISESRFALLSEMHQRDKKPLADLVMLDVVSSSRVSSLSIQYLQDLVAHWTRDLESGVTVQNNFDQLAAIQAITVATGRISGIAVGN